MRGRDKAQKYKIVLNLITFFFKLFPKKFRYLFLSMFRNTSGSIGLALRFSLFKTLCKDCGENIMISPGSYFFNLENISLGDNVSIHPLCYIDGYGGLIIGNDVSIAHNCSLITFEHDYLSGGTIRDNPVKGNRIILGTNIWVGCGVRILSGSCIGNNTVIGAGAVVKGELENNGLYAGVPVKKIKQVP